MKSKKIYKSALILVSSLIMGEICSVNPIMGGGESPTLLTEWQEQQAWTLESLYASRYDTTNLSFVRPALQNWMLFPFNQNFLFNNVNEGGPSLLEMKSVVENVVGKIRTHSSATRVHTLDEYKKLSYNPEHKDQKLRVGTNSVAFEGFFGKKDPFDILGQRDIKHIKIFQKQ